MLTVSAHSLLPTPDSILETQLSTALPEAKQNLQLVPTQPLSRWVGSGLVLYAVFLNKHDLLYCGNENKMTVT